jgi:hypothetical protein
MVVGGSEGGLRLWDVEKWLLGTTRPTGQNK